MNSKASDQLNTDAAAAYIGTTGHTMRNWRSKRSGPEYIKTNGRVFYVRGELDYYKAHHVIKLKKGNAPRYRLHAAINVATYNALDRIVSDRGGTLGDAIDWLVSNRPDITLKNGSTINVIKGGAPWFKKLVNDI